MDNTICLKRREVSSPKAEDDQLSEPNGGLCNKSQISLDQVPTSDQNIFRRAAGQPPFILLLQLKIWLHCTDRKEDDSSTYLEIIEGVQRTTLCPTPLPRPEIQNAPSE